MKLFLMMGHLRLTRWETWGKNEAFSDDGPPAPHGIRNIGEIMTHFLMMGHLRLTRWENMGENEHIF